MNNSLDKYINLIEDINGTITHLLEQTDNERKKDVSDIKKDLDYIRKKIESFESNNLPYNKIQIRFESEYELKLPKYGLSSFDRNLKGEMYFSIIGGNEEYLDIKTNSFPETFRIRLEYKTLELFKKQKGKAYLLYKRGREKLVGDETSIYFQIVKLS